MIRLKKVSLPLQTQTELRELQLKIDIIGEYEEKVSTAKNMFPHQNKKENKTFKVIRKELVKMCSGAQRCCYCEDSAADEVEHIKPKDLYPDLVFVWENYLYACGPCNGPKNNKFTVLSQVTGKLTDVTRRRGDPVLPPESGEPGLIDPRREDPLEFLQLDLLGTFFFLPLGPENSQTFIRGEYTIEVLRLNERDLLLNAREESYYSYRARLNEYIKQRDQGASKADLRKLVKNLKKMQHPTVWKEIKRQHHLISELKELFQKAPEARAW